MQTEECDNYAGALKITPEPEKGRGRGKNLTKRVYIICSVYKNFLTTETLLFLMSLIVDNYPLNFQVKLAFFHRRLCHIVDKQETITFIICFNNGWLQEKCEYFIQYYVSRHKCHFVPKI